MRRRIFYLIVAIGLLIYLPNTGGAQARMNAFVVHRSILAGEAIAFKAAHPTITPNEFATAVNDMLVRDGLRFTIGLDKETCENIKKVKQQQKDPSKPVNLGVTLRSVDAEGARLVLPEPKFTTIECGECFVELPILEMTEKDFITIISGHNIKFHHPANFYVDRVVLLDPKNPSSIKRTWWVPFRSVPIGVSFDEDIVYLAFDEPELSELSILVFGEGGFEIGTRQDAEAGGKGKIGEAPATSGNGSSLRTIRFERWKNTYLVGYYPPCDH